MRVTEVIKYSLGLAEIDFSLELKFRAKDFSLLMPVVSKKHWTELTFHKCEHCPLDPEEFPCCPVASAIDSVISEIHKILSYEFVHARVEYKNRVISAETTMQQALSSLFGLIIPASGCPHTKYFRPMSRYHVPFADEDEKVYRATTMFLLAQYFIHRKSGCIPTDFSRLEKIYQNVHIVNTQTCIRLRKFCESDCPLNAISILDMLTISVYSALKHDLEKFEPYFSAFTDDSILPT